MSLFLEHLSFTILHGLCNLIYNQSLLRLRANARGLTAVSICLFLVTINLHPCNVSLGGGISKYVSYPGGAGKSLKGCLKSTAERLVPSYIQNKSPIFLGATAGMRLVRCDDYHS